MSAKTPTLHPLKDAGAALDACGLSLKADLLKRLLGLVHAVAGRETAKQPVTAPGVSA